ncbi:MAG: competence type IV pilus minor pilin ComGF [Liquorilactobacillus ghanensis]|jgi:competence protein ComGF|uniref:Competence protein ComGF n=1 Tax=Liquorilactobacillus ghanensis DSM 18630 TaxID=1423750 RepID=A0A0R1VW11_9LACO|nr:competence type IV pilus minor pilin ComGF [Liquorilactobacillus ghanensis]KRM06950.1 hypothetical protein FC89_GL000259 [Liquorilactobacillus ghanensis DSM 18630]
MKSLKGFTLCECLIALVITSGFILIVQLGITTMQQQTFSTYRQDQLNWERFTATLTGDNLALQFVSQDKQLILYSPVTKKKYQLIYDSGEQLLKLTGESSGYLPLLYQVEACKISVKDGYLSIKAEIHKHKYDLDCYLPTIEG